MTAKNSPPGKLVGRIALTSVEVILAAIILCAIGYTAWGYLSWYGVRSSLLAHGEKLTLAELAPPPVPDAQNFFADHIWLELTQGPPSTRSQGQLSILNSTPDAAEMQALTAKYPDLRWTAVQKTRCSIAVAVWNHYAPKYVLNREEAARFTLDILAPTNPLLQRIGKLLERPGSRMLPDYSEPLLARDARHPYFLGQAAYILSLQAKAYLVLGDHNAAFSNTLSLIRLAQVGGREPLLMPFTIRRSTACSAADRIQQGLIAHAWTEADLQVFEAGLSRIDLLAQFALVLRGERACVNREIGGFQYQMGLNDPANAWEAFSDLVVGKTLTIAILPADQALYNRLVQPSIDAADQAATHGLGQSKITDPDPGLFTHRYGEQRYPFTNVFLPAMTNLPCGTAFVQDLIIQARLACALERYRLKNGTYPSDLAALVPDFLASLPADVVNLQPMHYQLDGNGTFHLWSVGWNETDDKGKQSDYGSFKKDDWVWGKRRS